MPTRMSQEPKQKPPARERDSLVQVVQRNKKLEQRASKSTQSMALIVGALMVSVAGNVYQGMKGTQWVYFAQDSVTRTLTPIVPLTQPISSRTAVIQQVVDAIGEVNSLDFVNYRGQLTKASERFTRNAWTKYLDEMVRTGTIELLEKKQIVMSGAVTGLPTLVAQGEVLGTLSWDLEVPYRVNYIGQGVNRPVDYLAQVKVVRVSTQDNPKGIAIAQFVARKVDAAGLNVR